MAEKMEGFMQAIEELCEEKGLDKEKCIGHIFWLKCNGAKEPVNEWNDKAEEGVSEDRTLTLKIDWGTDDTKGE